MKEPTPEAPPKKVAAVVDHTEALRDIERRLARIERIMRNHAIGE